MAESPHLSRAHNEPPALLLELEQQGRREDIPAPTRENARLLSTLVHAMQANRILEIGTAYGYATLWMALALPPAGRIWTIDVDRELSEVAAEYFERAGVMPRVEIVNQPPLDVLANFPVRNLDIVLINGDVDEYDDYLDAAVPLLKRSGLVIVSDILNPQLPTAFHRKFARHADLDAVILPSPLGIGIGARL